MINFEQSVQQYEAPSVATNRHSRSYIRWVQQSLNRTLGARLAVDGQIGMKTRQAIQEFQRQKGLKVDGIVGTITEQALIATGAGQPPSGSISGATNAPASPPPPPLNPATNHGFIPVAVENPGGGRIKDKHDPKPADVAYVPGVTSGRQVPLHRLAAQAWQAMVGAARQAGIAAPLLLPTSGYRSSERQRELWEAALKRYRSEREANKWVARPGSSAHQSGRAIDFYLGGKNDSSNVDNLRRLPAYLWLVKNAERFGFYPYGNEPWHWEYNPPARAGSIPPVPLRLPVPPISTGIPAPSPAPQTGLPVAFETSIACKDSPYAWARNARRKMQTWWGDQDLRRVNGRWQSIPSVPVGASLRRMVPQVFPGVPPQAFIGFCANGSVQGNTTECASETCRRQAFHEIGLFGTEAGLRNRPAPDPDPRGQYNSWGRLAGTDLVQRLLGGRSATIQPGAWKTAITDQVAVGLANLMDHGRKVSALLDPSIRPSQPGSQWFVALCFMGWSAGDGRAARRHINPFSSALAAVPEQRRWGEFLRLVADGIRSGRLDLRGKRKHNSIAWSALRTWQKLAAGQLLSSQTSGDLTWFDSGLGTAEGDIAREITCVAQQARR